MDETIAPVEPVTVGGAAVSTSRSGLLRRLLGAAAVVALGTILSRFLGLVRDPVMAQFFGQDLTTDAFIQAQTLSTVVYDLLVSGTVSAALIPTLSRLAERDDHHYFWQVAEDIFGLAFIVLSTVILAMEFVTPQLVDLMSGGYSATTLHQETLLARIMIPTILLMGLSAVGTAILYSLHRYRVPALAIASINFGAVTGMLLLHHAGIISAAIGILGGATLQLLLQLLALYHAGFRPRLHIDFHEPVLRRIGQLYLPVAAGFAISAFVVGTERHLYSLTTPGGLTAAQYATRLLQLPLGLVSTAISMAILPTISQYAEVRNWPAYRRMVAAGLKVAAALTLPAMVVLSALAQPIVALLFRHGAFTVSDAATTTLAFLLFAPQLPFAAIDQILINAFYALHDTRTPNMVYFASAAVWASIAIPGVLLFNWPALVAANTIMNCAHAIILFLLLLQREPAMLRERLFLSWGRGIIATTTMAIFCFATAGSLRHFFPSGRLGELLEILLIGTVGATLYFGTLFVISREEVTLLRQSLRR